MKIPKRTRALAVLAMELMADADDFGPLATIEPPHVAALNALGADDAVGRLIDAACVAMSRAVRDVAVFDDSVGMFWREAAGVVRDGWSPGGAWTVEARRG